MAYDPTGGFPDLATLRAEIGVPATQVSDESLDKIAGAEQTIVRSSYDWGAGDLSDDVYQFFVRSVQRAVAARPLPLGMVGVDAEFGVATLTTRDSEMTRLGGRTRKRVFA